MIVPCLLISALTAFFFCLPPTSGEKVALSVTVLFTYSVFLIAVGEKLPETSESVPLIGIYLTAVMGMTSVSVVMTVVVLRIDNRIETDKHLPVFLQWLVLGKMRRMLCMKLSQRRSVGRRPGIADPEYLQPLLLLLQSTGGSAETGLALNEQKHPSNTVSADDELQEENDWRKAARVIDRLLFLVFVVGTVTITVLLLVVIPVMGRDPAVLNADDLDEGLYGV